MCTLSWSSFVWSQTARKALGLGLHADPSSLVLNYLELDHQIPEFQRLIQKWFPTWQEADIVRAEKELIMFQIMLTDADVPPSLLMVLCQNFYRRYSSIQRTMLWLRSLDFNWMSVNVFTVLVLSSLGTCHLPWEDCYYKHILENLYPSGFFGSGKSTFGSVSRFLRMNTPLQSFERFLQLRPRMLFHTGLGLLSQYCASLETNSKDHSIYVSHVFNEALHSIQQIYNTSMPTTLNNTKQGEDSKQVLLRANSSKCVDCIAEVEGYLLNYTDLGREMEKKFGLLVINDESLDRINSEN